MNFTDFPTFTAFLLCAVIYRHAEANSSCWKQFFRSAKAHPNAKEGDTWRKREHLHIQHTGHV